jgi:AcrR family transcriptional regulator
MPARGRPRTFDRQEALQRAVGVFLSRGYDGATLEDLQTAMGGIAPPSFYAAFGSKENLFREVIELYASTTGDRGRRALAGPQVREAIEAMLRASVEANCDPGGARGCLLVLGAMNCTRANQDAHDFLRTMRLQAPALIRKRLERGVADGELSAAVDLEVVTSFYTTVLHGLAIRARDGASRAVMLATVDGAMAAWKALTTPKHAPRRRAATRRTRPRR